MVDLANVHLATLTDLYSHTKQAHWNVKGKDFYQLHELFDKLAAVLEEQIDMVAERATALGGTALGTVRLAAANSKLAEYPHDIFDGKAHLEALTERWGVYAGLAVRAIEEADKAGDADTADLFTEVSREIDKGLWFLESHLIGA